MARYWERYGCYPERILADKIYRSRQTLAFCKEHGIRLSSPALGKPLKNPALSRQAKKQEYQDSCDRNAVESVFGTGKTAYGLARITAHLQETAVCVIGVALLLLNLSRLLRTALTLVCLLSLVAILPRLRSRAYLEEYPEDLERLARSLDALDDAIRSALNCVSADDLRWLVPLCWPLFILRTALVSDGASSV